MAGGGIICPVYLLCDAESLLMSVCELNWSRRGSPSSLVKVRCRSS